MLEQAKYAVIAFAENEVTQEKATGDFGLLLYQKARRFLSERRFNPAFEAEIAKYTHFFENKFDVQPLDDGLLAELNALLPSNPTDGDVEKSSAYSLTSNSFAETRLEPCTLRTGRWPNLGHTMTMPQF